MHVGDQSLKYERDIITSLTHIFLDIDFFHSEDKKYTKLMTININNNNVYLAGDYITRGSKHDSGTSLITDSLFIVAALHQDYIREILQLNLS